MMKRWVRRQGWLLGSVTSTTSDGIVITLDDGPDPDQTPKVLEALANSGATATFFLLLGRARRHPGIVRSVLAGGHEIALHGPDHRDLTLFGPRQAWLRTRAARIELEALAECRIRWFRPPYGRQTPATWAAIRASGLEPVLWDSTTWDWKEVNPEQRRAKALEGARPGAILLAHDGIAGAADGASDRPPVLVERAELLAEVLAEHAARGLRGHSLSAALENGKVVRTLQITSLTGKRHRLEIAPNES